jgi:microcompartment protein CcmK/EutM
MILGRVTGTVVSTVKDPGYDGRRLMIVAPIDERGAPTGEEFLAVDHAQAGIGDRVLVLLEGNGVRQVLGVTGKMVPILELIVGVVDRVDPADAESKR